MTDTATVPLIPSARDSSDNEREYREEEHHDIVDESVLSSPGWFIWTLTLCAGISGLLFGFE